MLRPLRQNKNNQINRDQHQVNILRALFNFFCCKIEIAEKIKRLSAYECDSNIELLLKFNESNKFCFFTGC